jgi:hypothetical protein
MTTEVLMPLIQAASSGGAWYCGATGNAALARSMHCRRRDLELVVAMAWNLIARSHCKTAEGREVYATIVAQLRAQLTPAGVDAARRLQARFNLPEEFRLI